MFCNLRAEQARANMTDSQVADVLGLTRMSYGNKKRNGTFTVSECQALCKLFNCGFEYLFSKNAESRP